MTVLRLVSRPRPFHAVLLVLLLSLCGLPPAQAQDTGTIAGQVIDQGNAPLPGAQVVIVGTQRGSTTNAEGQYTIRGVPSGTVQVRASFVGYTRQTETVELGAGETITIDFQLAVDLLQMEEAVVTGSFTERSKIEASVALTTLDAASIERANPQSTADLLKTIPGFYVESSGGEGGNNLFARGIPADGSFRYVTLQENGLPVFNSAELAFANIDQLYRVDETVRQMEAVRGGTGALFASNSPAGFINFRSKTGGDDIGGTVKLTGATRGKVRTDLNIGGPFGDDWRFNIGGFYRYDQGVRDPGFPGNTGGQVSANVTRFLDNGSVRVYGRYLNDQNIFYLPIPLQNPDDPEGIDGFDPNYGTMTNRDAGLVRVPTPDGTGRINRDMTRGVHPTLRSLQADLVFDITDNLTLENKARAMQTDLVFNAIFSLSNPAPATLFAEAQVDDVTDVNYSYTYADADFDPANANGNGLVAETGWWHVDKPMSDFTNQLQLTYAADNHSINAGAYFTTYGMHELWHWHDILTDVQGNPRMLDLTVTDAAGDTYQVTENGFT
jgi:outer membrane receptor protein involved in Fe transport